MAAAINAGRKPKTSTRTKTSSPPKETETKQTPSSKSGSSTKPAAESKAKPKAPAAETPAPPADVTNAQRTRNQRETNAPNYRAWQLQSAGGPSGANPVQQIQEAGQAAVRATVNRLPEPVRRAVGVAGAVVRNPDRAFDTAFKAPMMTERLTEAGDSQSFEVDVEVKGAVSVGKIGSAGVKGKVGGNLTIERRGDGNFDVSLKQSATLTKVGDRKKPAGARGEQKLGWEGGARVSITETYTTSPAAVEDRAADLVRDRIGDAYALTGGPTGEVTNGLLDPSPADKAELANDWSKTKVEGGGFFRGQLAAKYGKMFGVETTVRDDWVQSGAVEVNKDGDVTLTLKLDNDISLKNGVFAKVKGVEGKLQELSDIEGSETTVSMTWSGVAKGADPVQVAQGVLQGDWQSPDQVRLRSRVQEHDLVEEGGAKVTFDGTHVPYTEATTEVTFDTQGASPHELAGLFKGDRAQARAFDPSAKQTIERFSYEGPDLDLKPEIKVPKAIKKVVDLSLAAEVETGIRKRDARIERGLPPAEAVEQIQANTLDPLTDVLPSTLGGPNLSRPNAGPGGPSSPGTTDIVDTLKTVGKVVVSGPVVAAQTAGEVINERLGALDGVGRKLTERTFETVGGDKWERLSEAEKAYVTQNPRLALAFNHAADRADAVSVERGFEDNGSAKGIFGDAGGNAYRHALWNGLMIREAFKQDLRPGVSRDQKLADAAGEAKLMADAHEKNPKNTNATNMQMDLRNNDVGRQIAIEVLSNNRWASEAEIAAAIEQALVDGRLTHVSGGGLTTATDPR